MMQWLQDKKDKKTSNAPQSTTRTTKDCASQTPLKTGGELGRDGREGNSCSTSGARHVTVKRTSSDLDIVLDNSIHK